jgi:hypothetical protein
MNIKKTQLYIILFIIIIILLFIYLITFKYIDYFTENLINNNYNLPKKIWIFWDNETLPKDIKLIYDNNIKILDGWDIKMLNNNNVKDYIDVDSFPNNYKNAGPAHKSDLIRLKLLEKYGGVWMDAGIIINSKDELEKLHKDTLENQYELTAFTLDEKDANYTYHQYIENWFLIAPQNSNVISIWLKEFENAFTIGFDEYTNYIKAKPNIKLCSRLDTTYLTQHRALQVALQTNPTNTITNSNHKLLLLNSEEYMFKLMKNCDWKFDCIKDKFENDKNTKNIPSIKLIGSFRQAGLDFDKYFSI